MREHGDPLPVPSVVNAFTVAANRLAAAVAGHPDGYARSRAICLTKLASLTMATGDPIQAVIMGIDALDAVPIRSRLTTEELRELSRYAAEHQDLHEVAHLRQRISAYLLRTDSP